MRGGAHLWQGINRASRLVRVMHGRALTKKTRPHHESAMRSSSGRRRRAGAVHHQPVQGGDPPNRQPVFVGKVQDADEAEVDGDVGRRARCRLLRHLAQQGLELGRAVRRGAVAGCQLALQTAPHELLQGTDVHLGRGGRAAGREGRGGVRKGRENEGHAGKGNGAGS